MKQVIRVVVAIVMLFTAAVLLPQTGDAAPGLSLRGAAGRFDTVTFRHLGNSTDAQAAWTNKAALDGRFSMLLTKANNDQWSYAAALVKGVEGMTVGDLGTIGFAFNGPCNGGSPRFNLFYDSSSPPDGLWDSYAFYGCNNDATPGSPATGWTEVDFDALAPPSYVGTAPASTDKVVSLSVLIDIDGYAYVDRVKAAAQTVGEP